MGELFTSVILGAIGMGYLVYGRKQKHTPSFVAAIGLFTAPYFVDSVIVLIIVGILLIVFPFFVDF